ncbi:ribokinase [Treponema sp. TIM-1]|uniref:ribokinase n=1 Tax=Treponema sp. TIM-1 TaxID=2898417 RepID=UPI0039808A6D
MKALVFGSLNIDLIFSVDHIVSPGETISSSSLIKSAGGKGANQAAALAKAGLPVYMAGKIGQDGTFLLSLLQSYGVNTDRVVRYEGATGQALIQLDKNRQNAILLFSGGNAQITIEEILRTLEEFGRGDLIVLQNEIVHVQKIMEAAKNRGLTICLNPSPYDQKIETLPLDLVNILFVNEIEGAALAGKGAETPLPQVLDRLVTRFPGAEIILTAGKDGAYYGFKDIREKGAIVDMPVVDTTGAGDTFTGYFIAARSRNMPIDRALAIACKAASYAVSRMGAMEAIPLAAEIF